MKWRLVGLYLIIVIAVAACDFFKVAPDNLTPTAVSRVPATDSAEWTLLIYMDADNNLEPYALEDLAEMQAGLGDGINATIVVQIDRAAGYATDDGDWTETRRYVNEGDEFVEIAALGELNMASAETLASFLQWGFETYPAEQTGLIMWGHGAGWLGASFDQTAAGERMTLTRLERALRDGLQSTEADKLNLIGFDACLMGQLEVYAAVQNYAELAVASEELLPGAGMDYAQLIGAFSAEKPPGNITVAEAMIAAYDSAEIDWLTLAAIDLSQLPAVTQSVETLAQLLAARPEFYANVISDARSGGLTFARFLTDDQDTFASIDLWRFASIVAQLSAEQEVKDSAENVMQAVNAAVVADKRGAQADFAQGLAIYFPRVEKFYDDSYASQTTLSAWNNFLQAYHALDIAAPSVNILSAPAAEISVQAPGFIGFELSGQHIEDVVIVGGKYESDGRKLLLEYDRIIPEPTYLSDGTTLENEWQDGQHNDFYVWQTEVTYLTDGTAGEFVVMWPTAGNQRQFAVRGDYWPAGADTPSKVNLLFDMRTQQLTKIWSSDAAGLTPSELVPGAGDKFQMYRYFVADDGSYISELGATFAVEALTYDWRAVDDGAYFLGFEAESITGARAADAVDLTIDSTGLVAGYAGYLDPYLGYSFLYPDDWFRPIYDNFKGESLLYTSSTTEDVSFQVKIYPSSEIASLADGGAGSAETLKQTMLSTWNNIAIFSEEKTVAAGESTLKTAYRYVSAEQQDRSGVFFTFIHNGVGFVVDIDVSAEQEAELLATVDQMIASWSFQPVGVGLFPADWAKLVTSEFEP